MEDPEEGRNATHGTDGSGRTRWLGALVCGALFVLGLAFSATGVRAWVDSEPGARIEASVRRQQEKFVFWEQKHRRYDVVFVGSSRLYRELSPFVFEHVLEQAGHPLRSFNFGLPGMEFPETLHTVDWLLSFDSPRLAYVVIELQELDAKTKEENRFTRRSLGWHTPSLAWLAARAGLASERSALEALEEAAAHLLQTLGHSLNIGTGLPLGSHLLGYDEPFEFDARFNGWRPLEAEAEEQHGQRREKLAESRALLEQRIAALAAAQQTESPDAWTRGVLTDLVRRVRAAGVEPIFLIPAPTHESHAMYRGAFGEGVLPNLFAYNDPERYPELYRPEDFFDLSHLDMRASVAFSDRFARDFAKYLEERQRQP